MNSREIYRHKKRGTEYEFIAKAKLQASNLCVEGWDDVWQTSTFKPLDMVDVAIYRSLEDNEYWVRLWSEWTDGRFEKVIT